MEATFSARFTEALNIRDIKPAELARRTGINESVISQYRSGKYIPKQKRLEVLSKALNVSIPWLMGYDVPMEETSLCSLSNNADNPNLTLAATRTIPLLGNVACGTPIFVNENRGNYIFVGTNTKVDFCLIAKGDSMVGARIMDGDIVFIRSQSTVEDGEIAAVVIDEEATLKRGYYDKDQNRLTLVAENPKYPPLVYQNEELNLIHIIGKVVSFQSDII